MKFFFTGIRELSRRPEKTTTLNETSTRLRTGRSSRRFWHLGSNRCVPATALGAIEAIVGELDERGLLADVVGTGAHASGERNLEGAHLGLEHAGPHPLANALGDEPGALRVGLGHDDRELFAAVSRHDVGGPRLFLQD